MIMTGLINPLEWLCPLARTGCQACTIEQLPNCVPCSMGGIEGCCLNTVAKPTAECAAGTQWLSFALIVIIVLAIYFTVGAIIATYLSRKSAKK